MGLWPRAGTPSLPLSSTGAFSGKVEPGFPSENATMQKIRAGSVSGYCETAFRARSNSQTIKARNPARTKPPRSIDQSPVSNPRSLPSAVQRSAAERNMVDASMRFDKVRHKHVQRLLAVAEQQQGAITVIGGYRVVQ